MKHYLKVTRNPGSHRRGQGYSCKEIGMGSNLSVPPAKGAPAPEYAHLLIFECEFLTQEKVRPNDTRTSLGTIQLIEMVDGTRELRYWDGTTGRKVLKRVKL